jgi:two-component system nitrogen regulation response regulator GlnG/two-component system response regulator HydG
MGCGESRVAEGGRRGYSRAIVKGTTTVSVTGDSLVRDREDPPAIPTLVLGWSSEEPWRVGEVAFAESLGRSLILGRGDDGDLERLRFFRQRPGDNLATPPLSGRALSRRQLVVRRFAGGLEVQRVGRCPLLVNGVAVDRAAVTAGDVLCLRGQLVLYCSLRPKNLLPSRYFPNAARGPFGEPDAFGILGESPAIWALRDQIAFGAKSSAHVLLRGDSGTGKELAARAIHGLSARAGRPLVSRNAATFPTGLIDAELFGNAKNYPNPGTPERPGLIGQAHGSTLFLDEIGELPHDMQAHLLRVLDAGGEYQRLGEATTRRSDLQLIGATNRPPETLKHDLLARFAVRIELPPLGNRREDIPLLVRHLLLRIADKSPEVGGRFVARPREAGRAEARVDCALVDALLRRRFATNVRELDGLLWNAILASPGDAVRFVESTWEPAAARAPAPARPSHEPTPAEIRTSVQRENGNVRRAAEALGLPSRYALYRLIRKYGIDPKGEV